MQTRANIEAQRAERVTDRTRAADCSSRPVEGREHPVTVEPDFPTVESVKLGADKSVVGRDQLPPPAVAHPRELRGGADQIGEQHSGKHPIGFRRGEVASEERFNRV